MVEASRGFEVAVLLTQLEWLHSRFLLKNKFIYYLCLAVLGLSCCTRAFSSCSEQGVLRCAGFSLLWLLLWRSTRALGARASIVVACGLQSAGSVVVARAPERRLSSCGARAPERRLQSAGSVVVARGLQSAGSVVVARWL